MFAVDEVLISDRIVDAPFSCNLGACLGACCVHGDSGAPLEKGELQDIEKALPRVRKYLRPEALRVIDDEGAWEQRRDGSLVTSCVEKEACVFVAYEGPVAKCALQRAYNEGRIDFPKPISCHLYPIRIERYGDFDALNYEEIPLCNAGRTNGFRTGIQLTDFLQEPLTRKYGASWYARFRRTSEERRAALRAPEAA